MPFLLPKNNGLKYLIFIPIVKLIDHMHKQHEREDFVHTEGPSYKSHFIVHDEDYER